MGNMHEYISRINARRFLFEVYRCESILNLPCHLKENVLDFDGFKVTGVSPFGVTRHDNPPKLIPVSIYQNHIQTDAFHKEIRNIRFTLKGFLGETYVYVRYIHIMHLFWSTHRFET